MKRSWWIVLVCIASVGLYADFLNDGRAAYQQKNYLQAVSFWQKACDAESAEGCSNLAMCYLRGEGVDKDAPKAKQLFKKACDLGDEGSCTFYTIVKE